MWRNYLFPKEKISVEDDGLRAKEIRKTYQKGRIDTLCSLAEHEIISMETASYLAGLSSGLFENELQNWRDAQNME